MESGDSWTEHRFHDMGLPGSHGPDPAIKPGHRQLPSKIYSAKRVAQFQATLVRRFTALEQAIAKSQNTQQRLSQLLASLSGRGNGAV